MCYKKVFKKITFLVTEKYSFYVVLLFSPSFYNCLFFYYKIKLRLSQEFIIDLSDLIVCVISLYKTYTKASYICI